MLLDKKVDNVKVQSITFVMQLGVKSAVVANDECQVQVICLSI